MSDPYRAGGVRHINAAAPGAVVLSGGPNSVEATGAPAAPFGLWEWARSARVPLLGVCYGMQLMVNELGGSVRCIRHL